MQLVVDTVAHLMASGADWIQHLYACEVLSIQGQVHAGPGPVDIRALHVGLPVAEETWQACTGRRRAPTAAALTRTGRSALLLMPALARHCGLWQSDSSCC